MSKSKLRLPGWHLSLAALLVLVAAVYLPGVHGGFVFDDRPNIESNTTLHVTGLGAAEWLSATLSSPASQLPRPLSMASFALNHFFTGLDPAPMKLTNIAIHLLNTVLAYALAIRLLGAASIGDPLLRQRTALFVAAAWALNPVNVMAVLYTVQRMESLSHLFVFAGLCLYLDARRDIDAERGGWWRAMFGIFGCAVLGAGAKESALLLPLYAACVEVLLLARSSSLRTRRRLWLVFGLGLVLPAAVALAWLLPPVLVENPFPGRNFDLAERLMTEWRVVAMYLGWTLYPAVQSMGLYHDDIAVSRGLLTPYTTLPALALLVTLAVVAWRQRSRRPLAAIGFAFFLSAQAMTATIIPLELVFEHRNYFASFGVCLGVGELLLIGPAGRRYARPALAAGLLWVSALGAATCVRAWEWRHPLTFAVSEAAKRPESPRAVYALGVAMSNVGGLTADSPFARGAMEQFERARRLPASGILPDQASLMLASRLGMPVQDSWWGHMQGVLRDRPIGPQEEAALGALVNCTINGPCKLPPERMIATFQAALAKGPNAEVLNVMGNYTLNVLHDPEMALFQWAQAIQADPDEPQYRISIIKLLIFMGRNEDALEEIENFRQMGRFGQYRAEADRLEARRKAAQAAAAAK